MSMCGDEQRAIEELAFTQAHVYLLYQWYRHCHWPLGTLQDWVAIMTLARSHKWSALNTFLLDKPGGVYYPSISLSQIVSSVLSA